MSKDLILSNLRNSLAANTHIPRPAPRYEGTMRITAENLLAEFITNHSANKGLIIQTTREELAGQIKTILKEEGARKVLYNPDINVDYGELAGAEFISYIHSVDENRSRLFSIDTSIVQARCGVANIGVIGISANPKAPRLASLITNTCIYLLDSKNVVEHLFAGIELIKKYEAEIKERDSKDLESKGSRGNTLPSNIIFVAGPSRTADIELQTVFGVHGPRKTYLLLY